jgi:hypothetical protein
MLLDNTDSKRLSKNSSLAKFANVDKLRDLLRKSSKERRHDVAKQVKENKGEIMTRTVSMINFK